MRIFVWLFRAAAFFVLFAFALNNQHETTLHWFFGYEWRGPMVFVVLGALALGCALGALAMLPSWWRQRRRARPVPEPPATMAPSAFEASTLDSVPPHPPRDGL
jgi:lipopolysaccharide assembly protein A